MDSATKDAVKTSKNLMMIKPQNMNTCAGLTRPAQSRCQVSVKEGFIHSSAPQIGATFPPAPKPAIIPASHHKIEQRQGG